jgi:hypothetical protein
MAMMTQTRIRYPPPAALMTHVQHKVTYNRLPTNDRRTFEQSNRPASCSKRRSSCRIEKIFKFKLYLLTIQLNKNCGKITIKSRRSDLSKRNADSPRQSVKFRRMFVQTSRRGKCAALVPGYLLGS